LIGSVLLQSNDRDRSGALAWRLLDVRVAHPEALQATRP